MRNSLLRAVAAVVTTIGVVAVLAGCSRPVPTQTLPSTSAEPTTPMPRSTQTGPSTEVEPSRGPISAERLPLGLEVRYVDEHGRFVTVAPEDFPR